MTRGMHPRYYEDGEHSWREHTRGDWQQHRMVVQRRGHEVAVDHRGLTIDGRRIVSDSGLGPQDAVPPTADPRHSTAFQVLDNGAVVYKNRIVAELTGGQLTVHGADGPVWISPGQLPADLPGAPSDISYEEQEIDL
ncbi:hypothetical protein [Streptomyces rugosispiralis]|uniref:Uncharacterized protein n=1 Tax=Streptomyces rugosispiralis TaxID=2967341 RepID=A0ABT1VBK4_9ACTN|nr:hypothetical protein [Streptomyces rugosispiralis]MCQ8194662.1 hypothetical protein [Streptomyces rugosispiralis]